MAFDQTHLDVQYNSASTSKFMTAMNMSRAEPQRNAAFLSHFFAPLPPK